MTPDRFSEAVNFDDENIEAEALGMEPLVRELLVRIGEDPDREGLLHTPHRVDRSLSFLMAGYRMKLEEIVNGAIFHEEVDDIVLISDIEFYSMCEHHMLPFFGVAHVAYIPKGQVIGLSKIPRIVELYGRRLQVQERMTRQIAECIQDVLRPRGVAVITQAQHLCMMMRGVEKQSSYTTASTMLGGFRNNPQTRSELLALLARRGK